MNSPQPTPSEEICAAKELLEWRDLQNAQMTAMAHVWDNPEDDCWNDLPGLESQPGRSARSKSP